MSHRVTTRTEIKDAALAAKALTQAGFKFEQHGQSITITSGALNRAQINLQTGDISGDSDYGHRSDTFGVLRQFYAEAKFVDSTNKNSGYVETREEQTNGDIVLMCVFN